MVSTGVISLQPLKPATGVTDGSAEERPPQPPPAKPVSAAPMSCMVVAKVAGIRVISIYFRRFLIKTEYF